MRTIINAILFLLGVWIVLSGCAHIRPNNAVAFRHQTFKELPVEARKS